VRQHFALLAAHFLAPLNRYLATLEPTSPDSKVNSGGFSDEAFLASLSKHGCSIQFKGKTSFIRHRNAEAFYRKFCRSPSFYKWLEMKTRLQQAPAEGIGTNRYAGKARRELSGLESEPRL
jgi:hypothetical protein